MMKKGTSLQIYESLVEETRAEFINQIKLLQPALANIILERTRQRSNSANGRQLLGELAPWLIADLLGIKDVASVQRLALGWLHLYFFVLMIDDAIDMPEGCVVRPQDFIVGSLLFQRGLHNLERQGVSLLEHEALFAETALAGVQELESCEKRVRAFALHGPSVAGQKLALLRICGRVLLSLCKDRNADIAQQVDQFLERLAVGIQLLDDLTDLEEDARVGRVSFPIAVSIQRGLEPGDVLSAKAQTNRLLLKLTRDGALSEALSSALAALRSANVVSTDLAANSVANLYVRQIVDSVSSAETSIGEARARLLRIENVHADPPNFDAERKIICDDVRRALIIVAQSS